MTFVLSSFHEHRLLKCSNSGPTLIHVLRGFLKQTMPEKVCQAWNTLQHSRYLTEPILCPLCPPFSSCSLFDSRMRSFQLRATACLSCGTHSLLLQWNYRHGRGRALLLNSREPSRCSLGPTQIFGNKHWRGREKDWKQQHNWYVRTCIGLYHYITCSGASA